MQPVTVLVPSGRVGTAEPVQQFLRLWQRQVVAVHLDVQNDDVDVVEEIQVNVSDRQVNRLSPRARDHPHRRDVVSPVNAHRRAAWLLILVPGFLLDAALAVQKSLHVRQERDELAVVT